jgi:hypothetical protein
MLARLMELEEDQKHLAEIAMGFRVNDVHDIDFNEFSFSQHLFIFQTAHISGTDDLVELLEALAALTADKRRRLIEVWECNAVTLTHFLIRSSWWKDASRDLLNITKALVALRRAVDLGKAWTSPSLETIPVGTFDGIL